MDLPGFANTVLYIFMPWYLEDGKARTVSLSTGGLKTSDLLLNLAYWNAELGRWSAAMEALGRCGSQDGVLEKYLALKIAVQKGDHQDAVDAVNSLRKTLS